MSKYDKLPNAEIQLTPKQVEEIKPLFDLINGEPLTRILLGQFYEMQDGGCKAAIRCLSIDDAIRMLRDTAYKYDVPCTE